MESNENDIETSLKKNNLSESESEDENLNNTNNNQEIIDKDDESGDSEDNDDNEININYDNVEEDDDEEDEDEEYDEDEEEEDGEDDDIKIDNCIYSFSNSKKNKNLNHYESFSDEEIEDKYIQSEDRISKPKLFKMERVRLLADRAKQLASGCSSTIKNVDHLNPKEIAKLELETQKIPLYIERELPGGKIEKWYINELTNNSLEMVNNNINTDIINIEL